MTQAERLVRFLRENPGASSLEITMALRVVNVTGRVSDARNAGHAIEARRMEGGTWRYWLVESPQLVLSL